jgi:hypothetical protein
VAKPLRFRITLVLGFTVAFTALTLPALSEWAGSQESPPEPPALTIEDVQGLVRTPPPTATEDTGDGGDLEIHGVVRTPRNGEPVPGVRVRRRQSGGGGSRNAGVTTDANGRFTFTELLPGEHQLAVIYPGTDAAAADTRDVQLADAGFPGAVELWMAPLSSITGRVVGADGVPVRGASVSLVAPAWYLGRRVLVNTNTSALNRDVSTDKDGFYELAATPGDHYIEVRAPDLSFPPHYYPGVPFPEEAALIRVGSGGDQSNLDISVGGVDLFSIRFGLRLPEVLPGVPEAVAS